MKNEILDKTYGKFNYINIKALEASTFMTSFVAFGMTAFGLDCDIKVGLGLLSYSFISSIGKFDRHAKDYKEVLNAYKQFIKDYDKLNKIFNFKNPTEVFALYNYLLYNGYLSVNKSYKYDVILGTQLFPLKGAEVFTGISRCDNTSYMLNDILRKNGNDSDFVTVSVPNKGKIFYKDEEIKTLKRLKQLLKENPDDKEKLKELENYLPSDSIITNYWANKAGEHAINVAEYNGKCYILDSTNECILNYNEEDKTMYINDITGMEVKPYGAKKMYDTKKEDVEYKLSLPKPSEEETDKIMKNTWDICKDNIDTFDTFYNDNKDMYKETSDKLLKIIRRCDK